MITVWVLGDQLNMALAAMADALVAGVAEHRAAFGPERVIATEPASRRRPDRSALAIADRRMVSPRRVAAGASQARPYRRMDGMSTAIGILPAGRVFRAGSLDYLAIAAAGRADHCPASAMIGR